MMASLMLLLLAALAGSHGPLHGPHTVAASDDNQMGSSGGTTTAVFVAAMGRSGSTALTKMLSEITGEGKNTYVFPEPFARIEKWKAHELTLNRLFDCSMFANATLRKPAHWSYVCTNTPAIRLDAGLFSRCRHDALTSNDFAVLGAACRAANIRVIKAVRLHADGEAYYAAKASTPPYCDGCTKTKLVMLVRHPWEIIKSQVLQGWHRLPSKLVNDQVVLLAGAKLCSHMLEMQEYMTDLARALGGSLEDSLMVIRYEDLKADPASVKAKLIAFLGIPEAGPQVGSIANQKLASFCPLEEYYKLIAAKADKTWEDSIFADTEVGAVCQRTYKAFNYEHLPDYNMVNYHISDSCIEKWRKLHKKR